MPITVNGGYPALAQYMQSNESAILVPWGINVNNYFMSKTNRPMNFETGFVYISKKQNYNDNERGVLKWKYLTQRK
jgi:hypothetical protein